MAAFQIGGEFSETMAVLHWRCNAEFSPLASSVREPSIHQVTSKTASSKRARKAELQSRQTSATTNPSDFRLSSMAPT
jgi:hypothetical protein